MLTCQLTKLCQVDLSGQFVGQQCEQCRTINIQAAVQGPRSHGVQGVN